MTLMAGLMMAAVLVIPLALQVRLVLDSKILEIGARWSLRKNAFYASAFVFFLAMEALLVAPVGERFRQPLLGILVLIITVLGISTLAFVVAAIIRDRRSFAKKHDS